MRGGGLAMGWGSATEIFDTVVKGVLFNHPKKEIIKNLMVLLFEGDWDTEDESEFWDNEIVQEAYREIAEERGWRVNHE